MKPQHPTPMYTPSHAAVQAKSKEHKVHRSRDHNKAEEIQSVLVEQRCAHLKQDQERALLGREVGGV